MSPVTTTETSIRPATRADSGAVRKLLTDAKLPLEGVPADLDHFLVAERAGAVVGAIGLERYGSAALLRSAVVDPTLRGSGIGERLVEALLAEAKRAGTKELVLLTTTAERWFPRFGFSRITRDAAPKSLHASEEFRGACPETAVVMVRRLD